MTTAHQLIQIQAADMVTTLAKSVDLASGLDAAVYRGGIVRDRHSGHGLTMREIKIIYDIDGEQEEWIVFDKDCDGEGNTAVAIFAGPFAEARAKRFAERLKTNTD